MFHSYSGKLKKNWDFAKTIGKLRANLRTLKLFNKIKNWPKHFWARKCGKLDEFLDADKSLHDTNSKSTPNVSTTAPRIMAKTFIEPQTVTQILYN